MIESLNIFSWLLDNRKYLRETSYDNNVLNDIIWKNKASVTDEQLIVYIQILNSIN